MVDHSADISRALEVLGEAGAIASDRPPIKVIPTSNPIINDIVFACGGIPLGRIIELYAKESVGKSTFAYWLLAQAQAAGHTVALWDAEGAYVASYGASCGINNDTLILPRFFHGEEGLDQMKLLIATGAISLGVIDAMPALQPLLNVEQIAGERITMNKNLERAKMYTRFFNDMMGGFKIKPPGKNQRFVKDSGGREKRKIYETDTTLIFVNHAKTAIGVMYGDKIYTPGGDAINFASSLRIGMTHLKKKMTKGSEKKARELQYKLIKIKAVKNKLGIPFGETTIKMFPDGKIEPFDDRIEEDDEEFNEFPEEPEIEFEAEELSSEEKRAARRKARVLKRKTKTTEG